MALPAKCMFLKKPLETLLLTQTQRSLFIESALKCPVMTEMLASKDKIAMKNVEKGACPMSSKAAAEKLGGCPFSVSNVSPPPSTTNMLENMTRIVKKAIHTASNQPSKTTDVLTQNIKPKVVADLNDFKEEIFNEEEKCTKDRMESEKATNTFKYEEHFAGMINRKKSDHSYRVFRKINRNAQNFPMAHDFTYNEHPKEVTVWCSNDYLGMSRHKDVVNAAK